MWPYQLTCFLGEKAICGISLAVSVPPINRKFESLGDTLWYFQVYFYTAMHQTTFQVQFIQIIRVNSLSFEYGPEYHQSEKQIMYNSIVFHPRLPKLAYINFHSTWCIIGTSTIHLVICNWKSYFLICLPWFTFACCNTVAN